MVTILGYQKWGALLVILYTALHPTGEILLFWRNQFHGLKFVNSCRVNNSFHLIDWLGCAYRYIFALMNKPADQRVNPALWLICLFCLLWQGCNTVSVSLDRCVNRGVGCIHLNINTKQHQHWTLIGWSVTTRQRTTPVTGSGTTLLAWKPNGYCSVRLKSPYLVTVTGLFNAAVSTTNIIQCWRCMTG